VLNTSGWQTLKKEYFAYDKWKEYEIGWSRLAWALPCKHVVEENIEERLEITRRGGRRRKQLLNNLKEKRGYSKFKEDPLIALYEVASEEVMYLS